MTNKKIPLSGVIGAPVSHSKSPLLHGHWLKKYGIKGHYVPLHVESENLADVLKTMPKLGFVGANVTIPHKEQALKLADTASARAKKIGAANTLVFNEDGRIHADNTDSLGFIANLKANAPEVNFTAGPALVLGAGGAARAVICALIDEGVTKIYIANRTIARAETLAKDFGANIEVIAWADAQTILPKISLLVNTTSLGMQGKPELDFALDGICANALVTDIVYVPLITDLLVRAKAKGCKTVGGLGMLLHQAVPGFEAWFAVRPVVDDEAEKVVL